MKALQYIFNISYMPTRLVLIAACCFYACLVVAAPAAVPYQGQLPDKEGVPASGTVDLTFSLFQDMQGGLPVWTEIHLGVPVKDGHFKVMLGKNNPLDRLPPDRAYFVGVQKGLDPSVPELGARKLLMAVQPQPKATRSATPATAPPPKVATAPAPVTAIAVSPTVTVAASSAVAAVERRLKKHMADATAHHRQGPGSGLNADLLDGKDSTAFAGMAAVEAHTLNKENPHTVTVEQIGAYSRAEVDAIVSGLKKQIAELEAKLKYVSVKGTEMHITGANLHVESGAGSTEGETNGLGNIIIGYNEARGDGGKHTGSHNLVIGGKHNYTSYGGIVAGYENDIAGPYACVSGGTKNQAIGEYTSITGGRENVAQGAYSAISGGIKIKTFGEDDWAAGGLFQTR